MFHSLIPVSINDSCRAHSQPLGRKKRMNHQPMTYGLLRTAMAEKLQSEHRSHHSLDNLNAALYSFCKDFGLRETDVIGSELRASYYKALAAHVDGLAKLGRSKAYIANRKSYLGAWHSLVLKSDKLTATILGTNSPFQSALRELIETVGSQRVLAREAGVSIASLKRWLSGSRPGGRSVATIRRIERLFGLTEGTLVELAFSNKPSHTPLRAPHAPIPYRERLKALSKKTYFIGDVTPLLQAQWEDFCRYKTSIRSTTKARNRAGKWRITESQCHPDPAKAWYAFVNGHYVPSAAIVWTRVAGYLGWLQLQRADGGLQMTAEQAQNLGWLVYDDYVEQYLTWKIRRSGGVVHSGIAEFPRFVRSLVNPTTGYLTLTPSIGEQLSRLESLNWTAQCERCFNGMRELQQHYEEQVKASRDSFEPIQAVLCLANPLEAVADMTFRMQADRPLTNGTQEAVWARDLVLIKLLMSNPLRIKNLQELTWRPDNTGQLYQRADGSWHIKIDRKYFKNHRGAARDRDYDNPVDPAVWPILQQYLSIHRPRILASRETDYVFVTQESQLDNGPWNRMSRRVFTLTARYLWGCPGVGAHAFRHIVATAILKASPNDWQTAALVLHDRVETVQKHYAHLKSADGTRRLHSLFEQTFARA